MRILIGATVATLMLSGAAFAAEAEGQIKKVDTDKLTITLDNGKSYKLPGEFDVSTLKEGMEIVLAYDEVGGENVITDMELAGIASSGYSHSQPAISRQRQHAVLRHIQGRGFFFGHVGSTILNSTRTMPPWVTQTVGWSQLVEPRLDALEQHLVALATWPGGTKFHLSRARAAVEPGSRASSSAKV